MGVLKIITKPDADAKYLENVVNYITHGHSIVSGGFNICPECAFSQHGTRSRNALGICVGLAGGGDDRGRRANASLDRSCQYKRMIYPFWEQFT